MSPWWYGWLGVCLCHWCALYFRLLPRPVCFPCCFYTLPFAYLFKVLVIVCSCHKARPLKCTFHPLRLVLLRNPLLYPLYQRHYIESFIVFFWSPFLHEYKINTKTFQSHSAVGKPIPLPLPLVFPPSSASWLGVIIIILSTLVLRFSFFRVLFIQATMAL